MNGAQDSDRFRQLVDALAPWIGHIVIVGGWAHRLYRMHPHAQHLNYLPLMTLDADIAVPVDLPTQDQNVCERLVAAGFREEFFGEDHPPATHYCLGGDRTGFYAEFLTPLAGSTHDRRQRRRATRNIGGVNSQQLRYIELLLNDPWTIELDYEGTITRIRVANPVSFLVQKVLIHSRRSREDRTKDILYMHDTLEVFGMRLPELRELWLNRVARQLHPNSMRTVLSAKERLFGGISDDIRRAEGVSVGRQLSPETLRESCYYGFGQLFLAPQTEQ